MHECQGGSFIPDGGMAQVYTATRDSERAAREAQETAPDQAAGGTSGGNAGGSEAGPPREAPTYEPPQWSGVPQGCAVMLRHHVINWLDKIIYNALLHCSQGPAAQMSASILFEMRCTLLDARVEILRFTDCLHISIILIYSGTDKWCLLPACNLLKHVVIHTIC